MGPIRGSPRVSSWGCASPNAASVSPFRTSTDLGTAGVRHPLNPFGSSADAKIPTPRLARVVVVMSRCLRHVAVLTPGISVINRHPESIVQKCCYVG